MLEYPFWGGLTSCGNIQRHGFPLSSETMSSLVPQRGSRLGHETFQWGFQRGKKIKHVRCFQTFAKLWKRIYFLLFPPLLISSHFFGAFFVLEDFNFKMSSFHGFTGGPGARQHHLITSQDPLYKRKV